jgi:putative transposase
MRLHFSEAQILGFLREAAAGTAVMELCWNNCFSRSTFRAWKAKYGAAIDAETGRLRQLELENARLRNALASANSDVGRLPRQSSSPALPLARAGSTASYRPAGTLSRASGFRDAD